MVALLHVIAVVSGAIGVLSAVAWVASGEPAENVLLLMNAAGGLWGAIVAYWMASVLENLQRLRQSFDTAGNSMNAVAKWLHEILENVAEPTQKKPQVRTCFECGCPLGRDEVICPNCRTDQRPDLQQADDEAMEFLSVQ